MIFSILSGNYLSEKGELLSQYIEWYWFSVKIIGSESEGVNFIVYLFIVYSVFQRSTKVDNELVIHIIIELHDYF